MSAKERNFNYNQGKALLEQKNFAIEYLLLPKFKGTRLIQKYEDEFSHFQAFFQKFAALVKNFEVYNVSS